jgi:hypothetical protein
LFLPLPHPTLYRDIRKGELFSIFQATFDRSGYSNYHTNQQSVDGASGCRLCQIRQVYEVDVRGPFHRPDKMDIAPFPLFARIGWLFLADISLPCGTPGNSHTPLPSTEQNC